MKELINDDRLTPTMSRVRSGRTQLFREKNKEDRSFISLENCDVSLEHSDKSMYAELIEGRWYWISGCAECNGKERDWMSYIECEKHDRCRDCGINRKDLSDAPWASKKGWICKECNDANRLALRKKAFEKLDGEVPDSLYLDEIICPHCGSEISSDDVHESQELECGVCDGEFSLEVEYSPSYTTSVKGERITE